MEVGKISTAVAAKVLYNDASRKYETREEPTKPKEAYSKSQDGDRVDISEKAMDLYQRINPPKNAPETVDRYTMTDEMIDSVASDIAKQFLGITG